MEKSFDLFSFADRLLLKLDYLVDKKLSLSWDLNKDLKSFRDTLRSVKAVLLDAEEKQADDQALRACLGRLNDVLYDAEDVLDEFEYQVLKREVDKALGSIRGKASRSFSKVNRFSVGYEMREKIKETRKKFDDFAALKDQFSLQERLFDNRYQPATTSSGIAPAAFEFYHRHMPSYLKQCFSLLSLFPKDYKLERTTVVRIWMALGLLVSSNHNQEFEDLGRQYIQRLSTLFRQDFGDDLSSFTLQSSIHDRALSISQNYECSIIKDNSINITESVRHLWFYSCWDSLGQDVDQCSEMLEKYLRSIYFPNKDQRSGEFAKQCILNFKYLRLLDASNSSVEDLPSSINKLLHLRYLDLSSNKALKRIPNSICELQHLQTLLLKECWGLEELPKDITNMISLRILSVSTMQANPVRSGVGSGISLRQMEFYNCSKMKYLFEGKHSFTALRTLTLNRCAELISLTTSLKLLPALESLEIYQCHSLVLEAQGEDDQNLKLNELRKLEISGLLRLASLPRWLQQSAPNLQQLHLKSCHNLEGLPNWFSNLTSLEEIAVRDCPMLKSLPNIPSLKKLSIKECPVLSRRCRRDVGEDWQKICHVQEISIDNQ